MSAAHCSTKKKITTIGTLGLFFPAFLMFHTGLAQFNDTTNYFASLSATGIVNRTNNGNSYVLNNGIKFNIYRKSVALNTTNSWIYGHNQDRLTNNDFSSGADVSLFKNERHLYYWALANYDKSYSLKINFRVQAGGGVGYYVLDRANLVIQLSDGLLYERSDLYDTEASLNRYDIARNSFRLKFRIAAGNILTIDGSHFLQHALSDASDYIIRSNTSVALKLNKWLNFAVAVSYNKLSVTGRENFLLNFGLIAERYF